MNAQPITVLEGQLVRYETARRAVAEAKAVDEVKDIRDQAVAMAAYARQAKDREMELNATEIRFRAERRLGEMIRSQKETTGLNKGGRPPETPRDERGVWSTPTLEELGINYDLSARAQRYASVPEPEFEQSITKWREGDHSTSDLMPAPTMAEAHQEHAHRRPPMHVEARAPSDLGLPITSYSELLATMKGIRKARGEPQIEADDLIGFQDGYIGKLEIDIRRATIDTFLEWMTGYGYVMVLVPAVDVRPGVCPCCGGKR